MSRYCLAPVWIAAVLLGLLCPIRAAEPPLEVPRLLLSATPSLRGLEPARGQRLVRLAPLADGRVIALYTRGFPRGCALLKPCREQAEIWHLVFNAQGLAAGPFRTVPELDAMPGLNTGTIISGRGAVLPDGQSAVFTLGHSSHNTGGGHFVRIDREGRVLARGGGEGSYSPAVCPLGRDLIVSAMWVDPVTHGYLWYEDGKTLTATVNLGGYGYNYDGRSDFICGPSAALGGNFALLLRKQPRSHVGLSLYRVPGKRWSLVGTELRLPVSGSRSVRGLYGGGLAVEDDRGVVMFRDASADGRLNLFYARFRITAEGLVWVDGRPQPLPVSQDVEGLDGNLVPGGRGRFYLALYQGGESAAGQPVNRSQRIRFYGLAFDSGRLTEIAAPYEDRNWSARPPLSYYAETLNLEAFSLATSCDGRLYVGGAIDGGKGPSILKVFSIPLREPATSACVPARPHSP